MTSTIQCQPSITVFRANGVASEISLGDFIYAVSSQYIMRIVDIDGLTIDINPRSDSAWVIISTGPNGGEYRKIPLSEIGRLVTERKEDYSQTGIYNLRIVDV